MRCALGCTRSGAFPALTRLLSHRDCQGYVTLNRIQSIVYPTAYKTNENMLVCAPTGAGKTDVAMLSILRVLSQHLLPPLAGSRTPDVPRIAKDEFKIIYVAPMKALAAEVVRKFGKRLAWIGIQVRELTGARRVRDEPHSLPTLTSAYPLCSTTPR